MSMGKSRKGDSTRFQCQVGNRLLKDAETQTEIRTALSSPANSGSSAFLTAQKLHDVFCDKTVRPCEPVFVNCPFEPEKLHCLDIHVTQTNKALKAIEVTKLQPLSQDRMEQQTMSKEVCKLSLKAARSISRISFLHQKCYMAHSTENLTNNSELETCDGQLLLTTSTSLENLVNSNLSNLQD